MELKIIDLIKIKYLMNTIEGHKIDARATLLSIGIESCPNTLDGLKSMNLNYRQLEIIRKLYGALRRVNSIKELYESSTLLINDKFRSPMQNTADVYPQSY